MEMEHVKYNYPMVQGDDDPSSSSSSGISSESTLESDSFEEITSTPLSDMSSLLQQLPIKKGLSRHYEGKSRSFTSLASVMRLEEIVKPEKVYSYSNRKLKRCRRSYGRRIICNPYAFSKTRASSSSSSSSSSLLRERRKGVSFMATRPPIAPRTSAPTTISNPTVLFA